MAYTINTPVEDNGTSSVVTSMTHSLAVTAGDWIVVVAGYNRVSAVAMSLSDTAGNSWSQVGTEIDVPSSDDWWEVWMAKATTTGTITITINYSPGSAYPGIWAAAISGLKSDTPLVDWSNNAQASPGTGTGAINSGTAKNSSANPNLVLAFAQGSGNSAPNTTTGWTDLGKFWTYDGDTTGSLRVVHKRTTSAASQQATFTAASGLGSDSYSAFMLILEEDVGGGGGAPTITDAGDELFNPGETGVSVTGTNFKASQGSGKVWLSPTDNVSDASRVQQTVTGWSDTSVVLTVAAGSLPRNTNLYLFVVNDDGQANAAGYVVQIAATGPTITDAGDEDFTAGETGVVLAGTLFGASQGDGKVYLCPTNDVDDEDRVEQTVTAWSGTSITLTIQRGTLPFLTQLYLFVVSDSGESNPQGYQVQLTPRVFVVETLNVLAGTPAALDGDVLLVWYDKPTVAAPNPGHAVALGEIADGELELEIPRNGWEPGEPVWLALFGQDAPYPASAKRLIPEAR